MTWLMFFLVLLMSCESKPTLDELVRDCQNRGGVPNVRAEFKCEMDKDHKIEPTHTSTPFETIPAGLLSEV